MEVNKYYLFIKKKCKKKHKQSKTKISNYVAFYKLMNDYFSF